MNNNILNINEYDYSIPAEKIAKFPLQNRDKSKLLIYDGKTISQTIFQNLCEVIPKNHLLVFNNTKVIKARLLFQKPTGAKIEILCLEPHNPQNIEDALKQTETTEWACIVGNMKKWKNDTLDTTLNINNTKTTINAHITQHTNENTIIKFSWNNKNITFAEILKNLGQIPIPPYLERKSTDLDNERYQTVYSKHKGSVAAPTAGQHFTENLLLKLEAKGIKKTELTLHVRAATFKT
jgi:S-adenosylmethionine:tRNA ribosyltransferase-isomerase